jgi:hypothetical protein
MADQLAQHQSRRKVGKVARVAIAFTALRFEGPQPGNESLRYLGVVGAQLYPDLFRGPRHLITERGGRTT